MPLSLGWASFWVFGLSGAVAAGMIAGRTQTDAVAGGGLTDQWDAAIGRMMASAPLTIRIDLDSAP
jgi:hypothetical protein